MKKFSWALFCLTLAGVLFSGYLSSVKFFSNTCAFNEPCPYFLGYPACYFGFGMFLVMFVMSVLGVRGAISKHVMFITNGTIGFLGILFAGNFAVQEFMTFRATGVPGFSTCVYGLLFYIAIFVISLLAVRREENPY